MGKAGDQFNISTHFINNASTFTGSYGVALANEKNEIIYILNEVPNFEFIRNFGYPEPYTIKCTIPENVIPGTYKLMICAKKNSGEWSVVHGMADYVDEHIDFTVVTSTTGINSTKSNLLTIYPNPVKDVLYINGDENINSIQIYTITGKKITEQTSNYREVNVSDLNKGIYIIRIQSKENSFSYKFEKQ